MPRVSHLTSMGFTTGGDRLDVLEGMKAGEFATVREAARTTGIIQASRGRTQSRQLRKPAAVKKQ